MKNLLPLCAVVLLSACGQKSPAPPPTASASGKTPAASAESEIDTAATIKRLTQVVRKYSAENRRVPKSFDELVTAGYLPEVPPAPGGKKYVVDDQLRVTIQ